MGLRAMNSAISGLQSNSVWLDVIGNNISNVNTVAYKTSRAQFADLISQSLSNGSGSNTGSNLGGVNPLQVGLGTRVASIDTLFVQGPTLVTGNATDISLQGDGFLVSKLGSASYLTRAGNLNFDSHGYLVDQNGGLIQGYNASLQYVRKPLISAIPPIPPAPPFFPGYGGNPALFITAASLKVDSTNPASISNIRIQRDMILPPKATTEIKFRGNLDSFQQPNLLDLFPGGPFGRPSLPIGVAIAFNFPAVNAIDITRMDVQFTAGGGFTLKQVGDLGPAAPGVFQPPAPLENGIVNLGTIRANAGNYAWEQQPPILPAHSMGETVYDSTGNPRQVTIQFYQLNDLGSAIPPINPDPGPHQTCYAWYAFETTGGKPVTTANLLGGTGIWEGELAPYDRGNPILQYYGDFIWFNTDGSLGASGGAGGFGGAPGLASNFMVNPRIYLPPDNLPLPAGDVSPIPNLGAEITAVDLNFGTWGLLGQGRRDGITGDAEGTYQVISGVNTYVPNHTVYAASQDGYRDGILQGVNFNTQGMIQGSFSNGQVVDLAQVAVAQVENPRGLSKVGSNYFTLSPNSGQSHLGLAGKGTFARVQGGSLEGSNVDLTVELSNMIVAQRAFEVNARVVSTVNTQLETQVNLGR